MKPHLGPVGSPPFLYDSRSEERKGFRAKAGASGRLERKKN